MRLQTNQIDPAGFQRLVAWNAHLASGPLEPGLRALVEARASQINGCAFCVVMHLDEAREAGVEQIKVDGLAAWRDVRAFDVRERAALALTETVTRLADSSGVSDGIWEAAKEQFDDAELTSLVQVIAVINAFNRINVTTERAAEDYAAYKRQRRA